MAPRLRSAGSFVSLKEQMSALSRQRILGKLPHLVISLATGADALSHLLENHSWRIMKSLRERERRQAIKCSREGQGFLSSDLVIKMPSSLFAESEDVNRLLNRLPAASPQSYVRKT